MRCIFPQFSVLICSQKLNKIGNAGFFKVGGGTGMSGVSGCAPAAFGGTPQRQGSIHRGINSLTRLAKATKLNYLFHLVNKTDINPLK